MPQATTSTSIIVHGAILGALTGLGLAAAYACLLIAFFLIMTLFGAAATASTNPGDAGMLLLIGSDPNPTVQEYLLLTILPGLLCIIAGGWVG